MLVIKNSKSKWYFLVAGALCILLSGPVFHIAAAGWCIPVGILYFMRTSEVIKGYLWSVLIMAVFIAIGGIYSSILPPVAVAISAILSGLLDGIPFLLYRILYKWIKAPFTIFLLPVLGVTYEYLITFPLSSIGALAATQTSFEPLIQMASITGVYGISFVMYWFASVIVAVLNKERDAYNMTLSFTTVMFVVMAFGIVKTRLVDPATETVKVSGIVLEEFPLYEQLYEAYFNEQVDFDITTTSSPQMSQLVGVIKEFAKNPDDPKFRNMPGALMQFQDRILEATANEARNGAKIIVWSETNLSVFKKDKQNVLERVREIARREESIILTSMAVLLPYEEGGPMYENKSVMVLPNGEIVDEYEKAKPVPFLDASLPGDGILETVETEYGKITTAICYDADFPDLMQQAGVADILLLPANDWLGVSPYHGDNAKFRAIENGVSIVRPTGTGQSVVFGPHGNTLARLDAFDKEERVITAHVPIKGVKTVFNYVGNLFVWLCIVCTIGFIGTAIREKLQSD